MPRLLVNGRWYEALASEAWLESHYERVILNRAPLLFPGWRLVPFKIAIDGDEGQKKADFALIDEQYREWWVVEVELAHHSLRGHVLPQVDTFRTGRYGPEHARYLARQDTALDEVSIQQMILGAAPQVLVVVNQPAPQWIQPLRGRDALLTILEPFLSDRDELILRLNGEQPSAPAEVVSHCVRNLARMLIVFSPANLGGEHDTRFAVEFEGEVSEWVRVDLADSVCLRPVRGDILGGARAVDLIRTDDDHLRFIASNR